jgi:hypothetical protein
VSYDQQPRRTNGRALTLADQYVQYDSRGDGRLTPAKIAKIRAGGQPYLANTPDMKLYSLSTTRHAGVLYFETAAQAQASNDPAIECAVGGNGLVVHIAVEGHVYTLFQCGAYIHIGVSKYAQVQQRCVAVKPNLPV